MAPDLSGLIADWLTDCMVQMDQAAARAFADDPAVGVVVVEPVIVTDRGPVPFAPWAYGRAEVAGRG